MEKIDLHIHSNISDGDLSIEEIIKLAKKNDCNKIAITDHEKINDYSLIAKNNDITIINGIEFNSSEKGMHILGYCHENIDLIKKVTSEINTSNENVCFEVIELLHKAGYDISIQQVIDFIISNGFNYDNMDKKKIVKYLIYKGYAKNVLDAYDSLIGRNQKFYIPIKKLSPIEIIDLINNSGGISVLAHPESLKLCDKDLLIRVKELLVNGLSGIEIINSKTNLNNKSVYEQIAKELGLLCTVGSDFHSDKEDNIGINVDDEIFQKFEEKIKYKKRKNMI